MKIVRHISKIVALIAEKAYVLNLPILIIRSRSNSVYIRHVSRNGHRVISEIRISDHREGDMQGITRNIVVDLRSDIELTAKHALDALGFPFY